MNLNSALIRARRTACTNTPYILVVRSQQEEGDAEEVFHLTMFDLTGEDPNNLRIHADETHVPEADLEFTVRKLVHNVPCRLGVPPIFLDEPQGSDRERVLRLVDCTLTPRTFGREGEQRTTTYQEG